MSALSAARGVSQVMNRCEDAKLTGFLGAKLIKKFFIVKFNELFILKL